MLREKPPRRPVRSGRTESHPKKRRTIQFCEVSLASAEPQDVAHPAAARDSRSDTILGLH